MNDSLEDVLFVLDMINMLAINDLGFFHGLNGILVLWLSLHPTDFHIAKGTYKHDTNRIRLKTCLISQISLTFSQRVAKTDIFGLQFVENAFVFRH